MALHCNNQVPPSMPSEKIYDGITIHLTPESLQNRSFHLGSSTAAVHHHNPNKGTTIITASLSLSPQFDTARHTRRPKLPTALSIHVSQYTRRNCAIHIPIYSRYLKERSLPTPTINCSASSNQTALQPWAPNDVDVLSRSAHEGASAMLTL